MAQAGPALRRDVPAREDTTTIQAVACPRCYACGGEGQILYRRLPDGIFGAPGLWDVRRCGNPACGLLWLDPLPIEADIGKAYANYYTHQDAVRPQRPWAKLAARLARGRYAAAFGYVQDISPLAAALFGALIGLIPKFKADADAAIMYLSRVPGGRVLEIGCGGGQTLKLLQDLGWDSQGVDVDSGAVRNAAAKGLKVFQGSAADQNYPSGYFDAVVMNHVIEHVHDVRGILREGHRLLRDGGKLVLVTPNGASWGHRLFGRHWMPLDPPRHLRVFKGPVLERLCREAGFRKVRQFSSIRGANWVFLASLDLSRRGFASVTRPRALWEEITGALAQLAEAAVLAFRRDAGEEFIVIAEK